MKFVIRISPLYGQLKFKAVFISKIFCDLSPKVSWQVIVQNLLSPLKLCIKTCKQTCLEW